VVTGLEPVGDLGTTVDILVWALGLLSRAGLLVAGICRLTRKKPYFPIHALLCLVFILRMITQYRHWSADPQLQDYGFYLCAHAAVMLAAYQHAAFDTGMGNVRALWISSLGAVYLCCAALPQCEEALLMGCCAIWAFTNLTVLPVRKRRVRPTFRTVQQEE